MSQSDELDNAIATNAAGPKRVKVGNEEVEQHPLADQVAASEHLASKGATRRTDLGIRTRKITPSYD